MSIRVWSLGTELEVEGEDRTRTQGLMQRLTDDLAHGARNDVDRDWAFVAAPVLAFWLAMVFFVATHWLGLAHEDEHWQPAERIAPTVGGIIGLALGWAMWQLSRP